MSRNPGLLEKVEAPSLCSIFELFREPESQTRRRMRDTWTGNSSSTSEFVSDDTDPDSRATSAVADSCTLIQPSLCDLANLRRHQQSSLPQHFARATGARRLRMPARKASNAECISALAARMRGEQCQSTPPVFDHPVTANYAKLRLRDQSNDADFEVQSTRMFTAPSLSPETMRPSTSPAASPTAVQRQPFTPGPLSLHL